jgi:hypothetical protein
MLLPIAAKSEPQPIIRSVAARCFVWSFKGGEKRVKRRKRVSLSPGILL